MKLRNWRKSHVLFKHAISTSTYIRNNNTKKATVPCLNYKIDAAADA